MSKKQVQRFNIISQKMPFDPELKKEALKELHLRVLRLQNDGWQIGDLLTHGDHIIIWFIR